MQLWQSERWLSVLVGVVLVTISGCASSSHQQDGKAGNLLQSGVVQVRNHEAPDERASVTQNENFEKTLDGQGGQGGRFGPYDDQMAHLRWQLMEAQAMPLIRF